MSTPDLPTHDDEVMSAHEGRPTVAEQSADGRPLADVDNGMDEQAKYGSLPSAC